MDEIYPSRSGAALSCFDAVRGGGDAVADFREENLQLEGLRLSPLGNMGQHGGTRVGGSAQLGVGQYALHLLLGFPDHLHSVKEGVAMLAGPPRDGCRKHFK